MLFLVLCVVQTEIAHNCGSMAEGDVVVAGQEMCVVEAMKMQNVLRSPKDTTVKEVTKNACTASLSILALITPCGSLQKPQCSEAGMCVGVLRRSRRRRATIWRWIRLSWSSTEGMSRRCL